MNQNQININIAVDVIQALSARSLDGHIYLMDNSLIGSTSQATPHLCTSCLPGQTIHWVVYALDLQTPVAIRNISFFAPGVKEPAPVCQDGSTAPNPDLNTWIGIVPYLVSGHRYYYRLELQMGNGRNSCLSIDTPSLQTLLP